MIDFAYSSLGLRFNPFGELDRQQRIRNAIPRCDLQWICDFIDDSATNEKRAVQFMGDPGTGKSTHLLLLAEQLDGFRYIHIPENSTRQIPTASRLMIDEAQRLRWHQRRHLFRAADRILLGTHRCMQRKLARLGYKVQTVSLDHAPDERWLARALAQKISGAGRTGAPKGDRYQVHPLQIQQLIQRFGSNIRAMERELYEAVIEQNDGSTGDGTS